MKWFSSFRAKLIFSIFPVVAGVTAAALMLSEWRFSAAYQRLFEEQFESQIASVAAAKNKRFDALSKVLEELAQDPNLLVSVKKGDLATAGMILRPRLETLAEDRLQSELMGMVRGGNRMPFGRPPPPEGAERNRMRDGRISGASSTYMAMIDPEGNFVSGPGSRMGQAIMGQGKPTRDTPNEDPGRYRRTKLLWLGERKFEDLLKQQEVGYLAVEAADRHSEQVREVFITPLRDPTSRKFLGAYIFGLPLPPLADRLLYEQSKRGDYGEIMGGIWIEGRLISTTIPADQREAVSKSIEASLSRSSQAHRQIILPINGVDHRLIYRVLNPESPFPQALQVNLYSLATLQSEIDELRRGAIGLGIAAMLLALVLILLVSRRVTGPIRLLAEAAREVERGNFDVRVPVKRDEVGRLAAAFNEMTSGLALQEKYRSVLNAVADRTVAERLIANKEVLGGEMRDVSMLFCDIRRFTNITEKMPPHEVIELLNEHMTVLTEVAYRHGGTVDKFVGDLIMVLFGAPISTEEDTLQCVRCAQEMITVRRELNQRCRHPLEVGIGIATGNVVAGCMGSDQRLSYTVVGQRVNLASRLCNVAQGGEIVVDADTASVLVGHMKVEPLPALSLKGFSETVECYRISEVSSDEAGA